MTDVSQRGARPVAATVTEEATKKEGLEARIRDVEKALSPLIAQITDLGSARFEGARRPSPSVEKLIHVVHKATQNFVTVGEQIGGENPTFQEDLLLACDAVKTAGESMHRATLNFSRDTLDMERKEAMVAASRDLLMAVTRLMVVVDAVDTQRMSQTSYWVEAKLKALYEVTNETELMKAIRDCTPCITRLTQLAAQRFNEESSEAKQQLLAAAQTQLNQTSRSLIISSKAFLQYPTMTSAKENRDYIVASMTEALTAIAELIDDKDPASIPFLQAVQQTSSNYGLYQYFEEFEGLLESTSSMEVSHHPDYQSRLEAVLQSVLSEAGDLLSLSYPHDYRQHSIITLSSTLQHKMKRLCRAFMAACETEEEGEGKEGEKTEGERKTENEKETVISEQVKEVKKTVQDLKKELTHAVMDQLSGAFLQPLAPMERVEKAAKTGKETLLRKRLSSFIKHAADMEKAAHLVCSLSQDQYEIRTTQFVTKYISCLKPQVVSAAQTLCTHPQSHLTLRNMVLFREAWVENVQLLLNSVEALAPLPLFMTVVEVLIREDSQRFVKAMEGGNGRELKRALQLVRERSMQLLHLVQEDVAGNTEVYSQSQLPSVETATQALGKKSLPWFTDLGIKAADTLISTHNPHTVNRSALEEAAQKVNEDIWELRRTVLLARGEWEGDVDSELQTPGLLSPFTLSQESNLSPGGSVSPIGGGKFERTPRYSGVFQQSGEDSAQAALAGLSSGEKEQIARETVSLSQEHSRFEREVNRWNDSGHDIIIIAKEMCAMMLDMSDFTKGEGQLKTAMDVIITAKDIARAGEYLYFVTKPIAEKCPNAQHRDDLLAHLDRMRLHTQQLKITSAVTLDQHEETSGNTVDTASAMLSAAKSLLNSVVLVVKTCYLASSAIARAEGIVPEEVVQWRLESPKKQRLTSESPSTDPDTLHTYREKKQPVTSPSSQLEEFRAEGDGKPPAMRERRATPVPPPTIRGRGMTGRQRKVGRGGGELEAIPEVSPSHAPLQDTTFF